MSKQQIREARRTLNAYQVSDRAYATTVWVGALLGGLSHLLMLVVR